MSKENADFKEFYHELEKQGKNNVNDLVSWLREAKILETIHKSEQDAKNLFKDVQDKNKVTMAQFEEAMVEIQKESKLQIEDMNKMLLEETNKFFRAISNAQKAFQDTMDGKDKLECSVA